MSRNLAYLAFTDRGMALAGRLADALGGVPARCGRPLGLDAWTARAFAEADGLVFVGAVGIAVRAVAPHVKSKAADPAVVAVDEGGRFAVPLLSGHLGGANDLARAVGRVCGAVPVITTATDVNGVFAVDLWARRQNCAVVEPGRIKAVSARLLAGETVACQSEWPIRGAPPAGVTPAGTGAPADFALGLGLAPPGALHLVPRIAVLGVGCRRGTEASALEGAFAALTASTNVAPAAICAAASIDLKKDEPGLLAFCAAHGWALETFSAARLRAVPGSFTASAFVQRTTGVDNVCERAALAAASRDAPGTLRCPKRAGGGVTMALAVKPYAPDWRWQDEEESPQ